MPLPPRVVEIVIRFVIPLFCYYYLLCVDHFAHFYINDWVEEQDYIHVRPSMLPFDPLSLNPLQRRRTGFRPTNAALGIPRAPHVRKVPFEFYDEYAIVRFDDRQFRGMTRLHIEEFDVLFSIVKPYLDRPMNIPRHGQQLSEHENMKRKARRRSYSSQNILFLFLFIFSTRGISLEKVAALTNLSVSTVHNYFYFALDAVFAALSEVRAIRWPAKQERAEMATKLEGCPGIIGYVDGTRTRCRRSLHDQAADYSGKTRFHCKNNQLVCDLYGNIIRVDAGYNGAVHDKRIWNQCELHFDASEFFSPGEKLLGDPGYIGEDPHLVTTPTDDVSGSKVGVLTLLCHNAGHILDSKAQNCCDVQHLRRFPEDKARTSILRRHRIVIEYVIGCVKSNWPMPGSFEGTAYDKNNSYHGLAFHTACALQQWIWRLRGVTVRDETYFSGQIPAWEYQFKKQLLSWVHEGRVSADVLWD
jgi:hypothetical protein